MALPLSAVIGVQVILSNPGVTRAGFGIPLILSNTGNAWASPELVRTYDISGGLSGVEADFATDTPEYAVASAIASQTGHPNEIMIGKGPSIPTQIKTLSVTTVTEDVDYVVNVYNQGASQQLSYTAVASVAWANSTAYAQGALVTNDTGKLYLCTTAGTSAAGPATGPSGTGSGIADGSCVWMYAGAGGAGVTTNDAIVYNLMIQANALADPALDFTAALSGSAGSKVLTLTADAAGNWIGVEPLATGDVSKVANTMRVVDSTTDPGVADDLTEILSENSSWYGLVLLFKSKAIVATANTGASAWCAANKKLLAVASSDTACAVTVLSGATDILATLKGQGSSYTAGYYHPRDEEWVDACVLGRFLALQPGTDNWNLKGLTGPTPVNYTTTQAGSSTSNIDARRSGYFTEFGGQNVIAGGGKVMDTLYAFINTRRNVDWYVAELSANLANVFLSQNNVPNTDPGRRKIAVAINKTNNTGISNGVISPDPLDPDNDINVPYTVTVPPVSNRSSFNAGTRALSGVKTNWRLAGSINSVAVTVFADQ